MAAEPVLGMPEMWPPLLDNVPHATRSPRGCADAGSRDLRSCVRGGSTRCRETHSPVIFLQAAMNTSPSADDEDDEALEDEEFDEDAERDEDDDDTDPDDEEEEETWQVLVS